MVLRPSIFAKKYRPITVHSISGTKYINIDRYQKGDVWSKGELFEEVYKDFKWFLHRNGPYKNGDNGAAMHSFSDDHGLYAFLPTGSHWSSYLHVPVTSGMIRRCYNGKGMPYEFQQVLRALDYYLCVASPPLKRLKWNYKMKLEEYAYWYLGLDCNGFSGAYVATVDPHIGITPNTSLQAYDGYFYKRNSVDEVKVGDFLTRENSKAHIAVVDHVGQPGPRPDTRWINITHSAASKGGLGSQKYLMEKKNAKLKWDLRGYTEFHHLLGPRSFY